MHEVAVDFLRFVWLDEEQAYAVRLRERLIRIGLRRS